MCYRQASLQAASFEQFSQSFNVHQNPVIISASKQFVGFLGVSSKCSCGAFGWTSNAPLLHHSRFLDVFPPGVFPGLVWSHLGVLLVKVLGMLRMIFWMRVPVVLRGIG